MTFSPGITNYEATAILAKNKLSGIAHVDKDNELIGVLSKKDCLKTVVDSYYNQRPSSSLTVRDYTSGNVISKGEDKTVIEVGYMFVHRNFKWFPEVIPNKLTDQVSRSDILKRISDLKPDVKIVPDTWKARMPQ